MCDPLAPLLVPVTVTVKVPRLVEGLVVTSRLAEPEPAIELGDKEAPAPVGNPVTLRLTMSLKPPIAPTVTLNEVLFPALILAEEGEIEREKSGVAGAWTVSVTVVLCFKVPLVPEIVMG